MSWTEIDGCNALERMRQRASCRGFLDREIPGDLMDDIIKTGLCAASGGNLQPYSIVLIRDKERRDKLCELSGDQSFVAQAPVNLLFVLDWYKFSVFAEHEQAPFTCPDSYIHFAIALEDVMCAAQSIETAAWLCGIGSCYVGSVNQTGSHVIKEFNLPKYTYPVLLLSLGYPKNELKTVTKLPYDAVVFNESYTDSGDNAINAWFKEKYGDRAMKLPEDESRRAVILDNFRQALLTTYPAETADGIMAKVIEAGQVNETQRRFGLHYHADHMRESGKKVMRMMADNGLTFFNR